MTPPRRDALHRPFAVLKELLQNRPIPLRETDGPTRPTPLDHPPDPKTEKALFLEAMADVTPLARMDRPAGVPLTNRSRASRADTDAETVSKLRALIARGEGFVVADTPEYMAGLGPCVNPEVLTRLHRGKYSIQGFIDLHGMGVVEAEATFGSFMRESLRSGKRGLLVIHGRGLSSPDRPVLKERVREWLTRGTWRKWVMAFSSARLCDGGAGATYVLLRNRPLTKRFRKKGVRGSGEPSKRREDIGRGRPRRF